MSDLVGNPEDRFSRDDAKLESIRQDNYEVKKRFLQNVVLSVIFTSESFQVLNQYNFLTNNTCTNYKKTMLNYIFIWAASWENQQCGFWPGLTQTRLYSHWRWLKAWNFVFMKQRYSTIQVANTKVLISFAVYREADLRLCFRICRLFVFSWRGSF